MAGVLFLSAVALFGRWLIFVSDKLIAFAPANSIVYFSSRQSFWSWQVHTADNLPIKNLDWLTNEVTNLSTADFRQKFTSQANQLSFSVVSNTTGGLGYILFLAFDRHSIAADDYAQLKNYWQPRPNILIIASDATLIEQVKKISTGFELSLNDVISHDLFGRGEFNLFLSSKNLNQYLDNKKTTLGFVKILNRDVYLSLNKKVEHWVFTANRLDKSQLLNIASPLTVLPQNFIFYISGFKLSDVLTDWLSIDSSLFTAQADLLKPILSSGNFSNDDISGLFNHPATAVFAPTSAPSVFGVDYVLTFDNVSDREVSLLKDLVVYYLAQKNPKIIARVLPDKTVVKELVLDRNLWPWQVDHSSSREVYYVNDKSLPIEFAYSYDGSILTIANSRQLLNNIFVGDGISLLSLGRCRQAAPNFILNVANLSADINKYLPSGLVMGSDHQGSKVSGCILEN